MYTLNQVQNKVRLGKHEKGHFKTIKGKVIDDNLEFSSYALIIINDTAKVGKTDLNGFFQVEIPVQVKKVSFRCIGFEPANIELADTCNEIEVVMLSSSTYDFMTLKRVDKLRMREFEKLPELHKKAFDKGIFKTDKACYIQTFVPYYKKKTRKGG